MQLSFKIIVFLYCHQKTKYDCCHVFCFSKLNCLFGFSSRKVPQRDSSMAAFVTVHAGSYGGQQEKSFSISNFKLFVFFYCRHWRQERMS